ncbi:MAG: LytR C-terminal domain-containing protein [Gemmatimonadota bacterium]|nr:LytR C-terminal domain-containing protein [Gemmatimonadota bacterium]
MAPLRTYGTILELAPAKLRWLIPTTAGLAVLALAAALLHFRRDQVPGHAYAIPSAANRIVVEVLNGSGQDGMARLGTRQLRGKGLDVVFVGTAPEKVDSTRIILRRGEASAAEQVRAALGAGTILTDLDTLRRVDVTVVLGPDYRLHETGRP